MNQSSFYVSPSLSVLVNGGNEARPQYLQSATCDASWSTGARILSSVVGAPQQKRQQQQQQQQQHILESRRTFFFLIFVLVTILRVLYRNLHHHVNQRSKLHSNSAEVPVLNTPVEVRFSMVCRFLHGQGKRGNVHIPAVMPVAFPDVVVYDGFILMCSLFTPKQNARE